LEAIRSIILGIVQGITEFFPVSSSGHIGIIPFFFNWPSTSLYFTIVVHFATLASLFTIFFWDIIHIVKSFFKGLFLSNHRNDKDFKLALYIIIGSIPAAVIGIFLEDHLEDFFARPIYIALFLLLTAAILFFLEKIGARMEEKKTHTKKIATFTYLIALIVGIAQAIAIFPGVSRSGATISTARLFGIKREECVRFSFLLSIPIIFGSFLFSTIKSFTEIISADIRTIASLVLGFLFAYGAGVFAIKFLMKYTRKRNLNIFAIYCVCLSVIILIVYFIRTYR
jgi:undecaprenyl-diphosphatase